MPLKLHNFGEPASIPKQSYFCQKLETHFRAAGFKNYVTTASLPTSGPKGKCPYVTFENGEKMGDSHWVVQEMVKRGMMKDLDAGLSDEQKADTRAWKSYVEEVIFPSNVVTRYGDDKNWAVFVSEALGKLPIVARSPLAWTIRKGALSQLWARGTGRYSKPEIAEILEDALRDLDLKLGAKSETEGDGSGFVYGGAEPTSLDVVIYSWLVCVMSTKCNPVQAAGILRSERLRGYVRRLTELWFPEYEGVLKLTGELEAVAIEVVD
ncbi:hypothetical protein CALCODRAFT_461891 [Calocera cornea HHB12733]|uniref:Thioredoxin-like fold domain-containing protein n=1 Tax=Calocera cornea HHB12733 TaxID=1353952 RepID=A0A165C4L1_9BASI|nr:hypothetical protein CALCODRAFT_461891 [Calocera cornea HHB12733]